MNIVKTALDALKKNTSNENIKEKRYTKEINSILTKAKEKDKNYNPQNYFIIFSPNVANYLQLEENFLIYKDGSIFYDGINAFIQWDGENIFNLYKNITDEILNQN